MAAGLAAAVARPALPLDGEDTRKAIRLQIEIEYPPEGATIGGSACGTFVAGRALAIRGELDRFDVMLVIDTSRSTIDPSGADINDNGIVGKLDLGRVGDLFEEADSADPGDSILAAEVAAARRVLRGLDPRRTRVGVVAFAGAPSGSRGRSQSREVRSAAVTLAPLTHDHSRVERALDSLLARDPEGGTHMAAGVERAMIELAGLRGALSPKNTHSGKIMLFFTDGQPTLPHGPTSERENVLAVLAAADRAARVDIRIHSFAIGGEALEGPVAVIEMAARTSGSFTPVPRPGDLVQLMRDVRFTDLREVGLRNATTGSRAQLFRLAADGSWVGFVKLEPGLNRIEVVARADDGTDASRALEVHLDPNLPPPAVIPKYVVQRNELLEVCLDDQRRLRVQLEEKRVELVLKELRLEIEQARVKARKRAATQRKSLELTIEEEAP
jgi:hypothetical protein